MSERNGFEPGVPCWVATIQPDPPAAAGFYGQLFGWDVEPEDNYFIARLRGRIAAAVAPMPPGVTPSPAPTWVTHVQVDDPDATADEARSAGGRVLVEGFDGPNGRIAVIADPAGAVFVAWRPEHGLQGAEVVNEPGAWAMSRLDTPDPEGAKAFYGAVFGWTAETFELGENSVTMFRLPGFVGGEPEQPVSREVVATMAQLDDGSPPRWTVDFWVDDVDAVAAKAQELDGATVVAPFDLPIARNAVLADPAGAAFSVTQIAV
jgi:predicted enzyme related to lactoylglutathione lyase